MIDALDGQQTVLQGQGRGRYGKFHLMAPAISAVERATVLLNPSARGVPPTFDGDRVRRYLRKRGVDARIVIPESPAETRAQAAASAGRGDSVLFAIGGDGSLRDAAAGLAGSETALAPVRGGTVNVFATEIGIPAGVRAALDAHLAGQTVSMDLGRSGDCYFLLMAGVGWDAEIVRQVPRRLKHRLGDIAYIVQGARMLPFLRPRIATWGWNHQRLRAPLAMMILGNTRLYGGRLELTGGAYADDGSLDMLALCPERLLDGARLALKAAGQCLSGDPRVIEKRTGHVVVDTPGLSVQFDGDFVGETPMEFDVAPKILKVRVPAGPLPAIFSQRPGSARQPGAGPGAAASR